MAKGCAPGMDATMGDKQYSERMKSKSKGKQIVSAPKSAKNNVRMSNRAIPGKKPK